MSAAPLSNNLVKVRKLLPVRIADTVTQREIILLDRNHDVFCIVPGEPRDTAMARAELMRDAMNEMQ